MLTDVSIPTSTGFSSIKDNLGLVRNSGIELNANYTIWQGPEGFVNLYGTFVYNKTKLFVYPTACAHIMKNAENGRRSKSVCPCIDVSRRNVNEYNMGSALCWN